MENLELSVLPSYASLYFNWSLTGQPLKKKTPSDRQTRGYCTGKPTQEQSFLFGSLWWFLQPFFHCTLLLLSLTSYLFRNGPIFSRWYFSWLSHAFVAWVPLEALFIFAVTHNCSKMIKRERENRHGPEAKQFCCGRAELLPGSNPNMVKRRNISLSCLLWGQFMLQKLGSVPTATSLG